MQHHVNALDTIASHIVGSVHPVVWASGGKDSLVLLHLMRAYAKSVQVLHVQVEDGFPGVTENLVKQARTWGYPHPLILAPGLPLDDYVQAFGHPTDTLHCKARRLSLPLLVGTQMLGSNLVFSGSKQDEVHKDIPQGLVVDGTALGGFVRVNPLYHWSDQEVYEYIDAHAITLPEPYRYQRLTKKSEGWSDCLSCTVTTAHWDFLEKHYPEEYARRWPDVQTFMTSRSR